MIPSYARVPEPLPTLRERIVAALPPPVGWKLITIAVPMAGGIGMPFSLTSSLRGTEN